VFDRYVDNSVDCRRKNEICTCLW